jgi:hypothetical protein
MLTWRYHLLTIAAVFLALALGVLIGIGLTDSGTINTSQTGLVSDIEQDLNELRSENNALSHERAINLRFQEDTFPYIVRARLEGKKIAILASSVTGDDIQRRLTSAIHGAGGQVVSTTVMNSRFSVPALTEKVKTEMKNDPAYSTVNESSVINLLATQLARDISKAGGTKTLTALQGVLIDSMNGRYDIPVDSVVIITRADDEQTPAYSDLEKKMLLSLKELGVLAVGCEPSDAPRSEIPLFQALDVSSVDNLDSRIGQVSLVYLLAGEKGAFGIKPTADMLIPILRTPKQPPPQAAPAT